MHAQQITGPCVSINGRPLPMAADRALGVRYIHNGVTFYGNVKSVIFTRETRRQLEAVFIEVAPRALITESQTAATVGLATDASVYIEARTCLTHIIKFVQHPGKYGHPDPGKFGVPPPGHFLCLKVWGTRPGWDETHNDWEED